MKMSAKFLRFFFSEDEAGRVDFRHRMAMAEAGTEDLNRTIVIHSEKLKDILNEHHQRCGNFRLHQRG